MVVHANTVVVRSSLLDPLILAATYPCHSFKEKQKNRLFLPAAKVSIVNLYRDVNKSMEKFSRTELGETMEDSKITPEELGLKFNQLDPIDFTRYLRQLIKQDDSIRFSIIADWVDMNQARFAKALNDDPSRWHVGSIIIKATRQQFEEDINAFQSGVQWQEVF